MFKIGCHVSAAGGAWNAPKNAAKLECEAFQIFTRPPMGGAAPKITNESAEKFAANMKEYGYDTFVVHCPYFVNFGSANNRIFHGSVSVVKEELNRANLLGAKYVMTHLGSSKDLGQEKTFEQTKKGLVKILEEYEGQTQFLLEIAAGAGSVIGDTFEELAELMEPLVKFKTFGGICFDTQHAFSSGYDLRTPEAVQETFEKFDRVIGLRYLKMSHINDSKVEIGSRKDRHEHIGEGFIKSQGFLAIMEYLAKHHPALKQQPLSPSARGRGTLPPKGESNNVAFGAIPLILETEHDKVEEDIGILKQLRDKI